MSDLENKLRTLFDIPHSDVAPEKRIQHLGAFWPHWNLHKRKCDKTGKDIVSIFRPECPYPVWHKDEWFKNAKPPQAAFDFDQPFFPQAEKLFKTCPIAHNTGTHNENCEYTDDWWRGKNCYLCHTGSDDDNTRYTYRTIGCKDSIYGVFSLSSERCIDIINVEKCYGIIYSIYLKNCRNSAFCYDCRNCTDCMFCFNLRNKQYCFQNVQYTREQFELQKKQCEYATAQGYEMCKKRFQKMMQEIAWHRALVLDYCENAVGDYLTYAKDVENTFFLVQPEMCYNAMRGLKISTALDVICPAESEKVCCSTTVKINSYEVRFSFQLNESRFVDYSAYSAQIENCFGCCGLVGAKNCIMNTPYSIEEYSALKQRITDHMKSTGEWGQFFPGSFAPNPYDESWSSFYFPLTPEEQKAQGYFYLPNSEKRESSHCDIHSLPRTANDADESTTKNVYWDEIAQRPFQILPQDINLCRELEVALPHTYYMRRILDNFRWMPYNGTLRTTKCAKSGTEIQTSWPSEYDGRILSEDEYLKVIG